MPTMSDTPTSSAETTHGNQVAGGAASASGPYAIVEVSGQQFWLEPGRYYDIDRLDLNEDATLAIENVLLVRSANGAEVGRPYVEAARVNLKVLAHRRGPKLIVYKMRRKKKTRSKNGHRQALTRVQVESITIAGQVIT